MRLHKRDFGRGSDTTPAIRGSLEQSGRLDSILIASRPRRILDDHVDHRCDRVIGAEVGACT